MPVHGNQRMCGKSRGRKSNKKGCPKYRFKAKATYLQFLIMFEKISESKRILNVAEVNFRKLDQPQRSKFQLIDGEFFLEAYKYNNNYKEDRGLDQLEKQFSGKEEEQEEEEIMFAHGSSKSSSETEEQRKNIAELSKASLVYLMDRKINTDGDFEKEVLADYKKKYCKAPSKYAVIGFDVVNDMLTRENSKGELFKQMNKAQTQLATKFEFVRNKNGAYVNQGYRVVRLVP